MSASPPCTRRPGHGGAVLAAPGHWVGAGKEGEREGAARACASALVPGRAKDLALGPRSSSPLREACWCGTWGAGGRRGASRHRAGRHVMWCCALLRWRPGGTGVQCGVGAEAEGGQGTRLGGRAAGARKPAARRSLRPNAQCELKEVRVAAGLPACLYACPANCCSWGGEVVMRPGARPPQEASGRECAAPHPLPQTSVEPRPTSPHPPLHPVSAARGTPTKGGCTTTLRAR